jgi:hypothetical protein
MGHRSLAASPVLYKSSAAPFKQFMSPLEARLRHNRDVIARALNSLTADLRTYHEQAIAVDAKGRPKWKLRDCPVFEQFVNLQARLASLVDAVDSLMPASTEGK